MIDLVWAEKLLEMNLDSMWAWEILEIAILKCLSTNPGLAEVKS